MKTQRVVLVAVLVLITGGAALVAQATGEWIQPYPQAPGYWELVGRLFADTPALRRDRGFRGFLDPSILVAGSIQPKTKSGNILGSFVRFQLVQGENVLNADLPPDRLVAAEITQVLFGFAADRSLRIDVRNGNPSSEFQQCADARHQRFSHMVDVRVQAAMLCEGALFWTSWRTQTVTLDAASVGLMPLDNIGTLRLTFDARSGEVSASVQIP